MTYQWSCLFSKHVYTYRITTQSQINGSCQSLKAFGNLTPDKVFRQKSALVRVYKSGGKIVKYKNIVLSIL
jgi:hypothetical protein